MNNIIELNEQSFELEAMRASTPVLVDFYAPWCGPCKMLAPALEKLAGEFANRVKIAKVNVDDAGALARRFGITGVPTLILFRDGQILETMVGIPALSALRARLEEAAAARVAAGTGSPTH